MKTMDLRAYIKTLTPAQLDDFAARCDSTTGHIRNVAGGHRTCGEYLAINIDRESKGVVPCEISRPDVDWAYLRGSTTESLAKSV